ncbi:hypothetical protein FRC12_003589 [Ceratobasidium sp. 428]|nr:hypothetical protein FRC12_003589 [Ceratobasidium sp. 428]
MHAMEYSHSLASSPSELREDVQPGSSLKTHSSKTAFAAHSSAYSNAGINDKKLGFFGPKDPTTFPLHMKLCLGGVLVFPLWWIGAVLRCDEVDCWSTLWQFRCRVMTIISTLIVAGAIVTHGLSMLD